MDNRDLALRVAWHYLGTPYIWGGDDPSGFDCSGFVIEILQSVGILPRQGDWTAASLWYLFQQGRRDLYSDYTAGDLIFWRSAENADAIIHIEMLVDQTRSIGAQGGGSANVTTADAWRRNSYVKIRPFASRSFMAGVLNPFYKLEGKRPNVA
jgi:cell wall-associated NlpC family hydrolase